MKKITLLLLILFVSFSLHSQTNTDREIKKYERKLNGIDKKSIKTKYLLNKGFLMANILDDYFNYEGFDEDGFTVVDRIGFKTIYKGLRKSDLSKFRRLDKYDFKTLRKKYKSKPNSIPIGVIQARGEYLDSLQIEKNIKKAEKNISIKDKYTGYNIFSAGVLKKKVLSGNVTFEVIPELFNIQNPNSIESLEIDFSDGQGFRSLNKGNKYNIRYESIGEKVVAIRFKQEKKAFISYSKFEVITLNDEQPNMAFFPETGSVQKGKAAIQSSREYISSSFANSSPSGGGIATVFLGCDVSFDKPVIVIEGFDPLNENSSANLRANYNRSSVERIFRANGHDMVYFNFQNGGDDIIKNANVIRNLINQVNREKVGNEDIIVIGESMGGLIARLAIRGLEMANIPHNISHYISFDAPHKGANLPVGFQSLIRDIDDVDVLTSDIRDDLEEALDRLDAKAARQLLLRFNGPNPHPDFTALQNELNRVGFPQKEGIRNIAIVNGAIDGSIGDRDFFDAPGRKIVQADGAIAGILRVGTEVVSNNFGGSTTVSVFAIRTLGIPTTSKRSTFSFNNINFDIASGGGADIEQEVDAFEGFDVDIASRFVTFVPLFSGLGSTRNIASQTDLNRSESFLRARGQVPFNRVYGNTTNTEHINASSLFNQWQNLLTNEFSLNLFTSCNQNPTTNISPNSPRINASTFFTCQFSGNDVTLNVDNNPDFIGNLYSHRWRVTGPRTFNGSGNSVRLNSTLPAGVYTVTVTRDFSSATINDLPESTRDRIRSSSSSRSFTIFNSSSRFCSNITPPGPGGGGIPLTVNLDDFETDVEAESKILVWPNPAQNIVNISYKIEEESKILVSLTGINSFFDKVISIGEETRKPGEYTDGFDLSQFTNGVYVLIVDINGVQTRSKIIINKN